MKIVSLKGPAVIDGVVRYPTEGDLIVTDEEAERLQEGGFLVEEGRDPPVDEAQKPAPKAKA